MTPPSQQIPRHIRLGATIEVDVGEPPTQAFERAVVSTIDIEARTVGCTFEDDYTADDAPWEYTRPISRDGRARFTTWRQHVLVKQSGRSDINTIALFERPNAAGGEGIRVWCRGVIVGAEWHRVQDLDRRGPREVVLAFPSSKYERMPARLSLVRPSHVGVGSRWSLLGEDGRAPEGVYVQRADERHRWASMKKAEEGYEGG